MVKLLNQEAQPGIAQAIPMMIIKASSRGETKTEWLDSKHSFSFAEYYNPDKMGYRSLRVVNEDRVSPSRGFPNHPHSDMEILTYVISGKLAHKDSMGNGSVIEPGDFQLMTAGEGVIHSEFNASEDDECHFYQIWIKPHAKDLKPGYQQKSIKEPAIRRNSLTPIVTPAGGDDTMSINQNAEITLGVYEKDETINFPQKQDYPYGFLQILEGKVKLAEHILEAGDGAGFEFTRVERITAVEDCRLLLFYLT